MRSGLELTRHLLDNAYQTLDANLESLTLEEALFVPEGGFRSVLGTLKHAAGWSHVYRSFAFDREPRNWHQLQWPRGLRDEEGEEVEENNVSTEGHRVVPPSRAEK